MKIRVGWLSALSVKGVLVAGLMLVFFVAPAHASTATFFEWGDDADQVHMLDGGSYAVPFHTAESAYAVDTFSFDSDGILFYVPNPADDSTRIQVAQIGGTGGVTQWSWEQAGTYELDVYDVPIFFNAAPSLWSRMLALLIGPTAYADDLGDYSGTIRFTVSEAAATPSGPNPVIIIPGILGSTYKNGQWMLDQQGHIYDNLVDTLIANGYSTSTNLFPFPYDWHQSNVDTAVQLKAKIDAVKSQTGASKVDLVAHSMGGLVARQYIQSPDYQGDVDQMIFLGTPQLGSPQDYLMWEAGNTPSDPLSLVINTELTLEAFEHGSPNIFSYIHSEPIPSVQQLLPVYSYLYDQSGNLETYPSGYPTNPFLKNLDDNFGSLTASGVAITNIAGDDGSGDTLTSIQVKPSTLLPFWPDGMPIGLLQIFGYKGLNYGGGDSTVPSYSSSSLFPDSTVITSTHSGLPTNAEGQVYKILTGNVATTLINKSLPSRFLAFLAHSPIDIQVTAPDGKRMGKDFTTGQEFDEISGAFYTGYDTDTEFIVIPDPEDGQYTIGAQGTGSGGAYTISSDYVTNGATTQADASGTIAGGATTLAVATLTSSGQSPLVVQQSLADLIANLTAAVNSLTISAKTKAQLLNKIANLNTKIAKQAQKQSTVLANLEAQINKKVAKGKIDPNAATDMGNLLDSLIAQEGTVPLDPSLLAQLTSMINALGAKPALTTSLLNKVARLQNLSSLDHSLANLTNSVTRKQNNGKLLDTDAQTLLNLLDQIQSAL